MASTSAETVPLLSTGTVEYGGIEPKVHSGYGHRRIPLKPSVAAPLAAGHQYQRIFETQLGSAASDPKNPIVSGFHNWFYNKSNTEEEEPPRFLYKPPNLRWNKETRALYPEHWKLERNQARGQQLIKEQTQQEELKNGIVLPFSNNIGPGNSIQPARTASDTIAQGHDLHYKDAKEDTDVLSADREAIDHFIQEAIGGSDPVSQLQGVIGAAGLGAKHIAETLAGKVFYGNYVFTLS